MFTVMDGIRSGRCLDGESLDHQPGGPVHVYPCTKKWNQFLSFGNGKQTPAGSIHTTIPLHTRNRIAQTGKEQEAYMCLGVAKRGSLDEEDWFNEREDFLKSYEEEEQDDKDNQKETEVLDSDGHKSLIYWYGKHLMATKCSNEGAVIEWVLVPFIVEEVDNDSLSNETDVAENETSEDEEL